MKKFVYLIFVLFVLSSCSSVFHMGEKTKKENTQTVVDRLNQYGKAARSRLKPYFDAAGVSYPPSSYTLLGLKSEKRLELYAADQMNQLKFIRAYPICAASGLIGPKLKEGDKQVPEGIYKIIRLNPNSSYHLSLRLNYPNLLDKFIAVEEGRTNLGGDIMIHGKCSSRGCLSIMDQPVEELFVLAADAGLEDSKVLLAPYDFRRWRIHQDDLGGLPEWTLDLYTLLAEELYLLPLPNDLNSQAGLPES